MLERPVFGGIHPAIVFVLPAVVSEAADERSGKVVAGRVVIQSHSWWVEYGVGIPSR